MSDRKLSLADLSPEMLERALRDPELVELLEEDRRRRVGNSLVDWCAEALAPQGQRPARHHELICRELEGLERGDFDRLMVLAPPGSAKSTYASVLFPPWWLKRRPRTAVIAASHTGELAEDFGRKVRNTVSDNQDLLGYSLAEDSQAAGKWNTDRGGEYRTFGVGKAIAGRRADLCIIDDPVAGREAAESQSDRDRVWRWYTGDVYHRLKPGGRIVLIMTRWHEDDLGGRLLQEMERGGDKWRIIKLTALAENFEVRQGVRFSTPDPLGRRDGEALWPDWENEEMLERKKRVSGEREWASQFQQRPAPTEGILFHTDLIRKISELPGNDYVQEECRAWDLAATEQVGTRDPDWTVGLRMARLASGRYVVVDVVRLRGAPQDVEAAILDTAAEDGPDVRISLPQDPGQAGKSQIAYLTGRLAGYRVVSSTETGSKSTRAMPVASQSEVGNLLVLDRHWTHGLLSEMQTFPSGSKDDQVDALSRAFNLIALKNSASAFIDHLRGELDGVAEPAPTRVAPGASAQNQSLVRVYQDTMAALRKPEVVCFRCRMPLGGSRVEDGVSVWHPQCFS
jgi:predicted phage terminase large subunit-like protein